MRLITRRDGPSGRFYEIDGQLLPSVTNILTAINKPALVFWAANQERAAVTEAAADLYQLWAQQPDAKRIPLPRSAYLSTLHARLGTVRAHQKTLAKAGDIGTEAHRLIEWTMRGAMGAAAGPKPVVCDAALWAFMAFEDYARSVNLKPLLIERTVYSTRHGYAGTMDILARVNGAITLIDIKTGRSVYHEAHLQSAAYQTALIEMGYLPPAGGGLIIRLPKVETDPAFEVVAVRPTAGLLPVFLAAKELWKWSYDNEAAYRSRRAKAVA